MLSILNEIDPCFVASAVYFVWDTKPDFPTWLDCNWLTHKFVQNLCSLINLAWIFSFLHVPIFFFFGSKISHFNTLKQVYWLAKARQNQASFIFLVEQATIDTQNLKLKVFHSMDLFSPWTGLCYNSNLDLTLIFRKKISLVVFYFVLFCFFFVGLQF